LQAAKGIEARTAIGAKGKTAMHNIEHKPAQEVQGSTSNQKGTTMTERHKLPRAWRYTIIGGSVLLVFAVIIAGLLTLANQKAKQSPRIVPTPTIGASTIPTTVAREATLPTPDTTPIPAPVLTGYNVNVTVANGVAYLSTYNNSVYALRISNGSLLWNHKIDGSADQPPLVANGIAYVVSFIGQNGPAHIYALSTSDGSLLWQYDNTNYSYLSLSPTNSNVVYIASQDGISALQSSNGALLWRYSTQGNTASELPLEVNGVVYYNSSLASGSNTLYALRASNGTRIWQYATGDYTPTLTVANGVVYINSNSGTFAALRASDGHQLWKRTLETNMIQSSQLVNGILYVTTTKILLPSAARNTSPLQGATALGALLWNTIQNVHAAQTLPYKQGLSAVYAIRASDGTVLWHYTLNNGKNSWASWLSVENGIVYASAANAEGTTGAGDMYALQSSNGSVLWHDTLQASPSGASLANGVIYLSASDNSGYGAVYAVRARDGSPIWSYPISGALFAAPVLEGNTIYAGATNGIAYALRADNGRIVWHYLIQVGG
jgi:outer membrane protein assembly factor BamB